VHEDTEGWLSAKGPYATPPKPQDSWHAAYGDTSGAEAYKDSIGTDKDRPEYKAATEWGGTEAAPFSVTAEELMTEILVPSIAARAKGHEAQLQSYMEGVAQAFRIMKVDSIEAQALFLGHAAGETAFAILTEGQTKDFVDKPEDVVVTTSMHDGADADTLPDGPMRYETAHEKTVDPLEVIDQGMDENQFDSTFIGRGPIQVTHRHGYMQTLMYMEKQHDSMPEGRDKDLLREAIVAIKKEPREAANPRYSFLFSAAYMHRSYMVQRKSFTTAGMSGGATDPKLDVKTQTFNRALAVLKRKKEKHERDANLSSARGCTLY
jgi:hypothetical protein